VFIKYEAEVSSRVGGGERGVVDFGKLFTETNEQGTSTTPSRGSRRQTSHADRSDVASAAAVADVVGPLGCCCCSSMLTSSLSTFSEKPGAQPDSL